MPIICVSCGAGFSLRPGLSSCHCDCRSPKPKILAEVLCPKSLGALLYPCVRRGQSPERHWAAIGLQWERRGRDGGVDTRCELGMWLHGIRLAGSKGVGCNVDPPWGAGGRGCKHRASCVWGWCRRSLLMERSLTFPSWADSASQPTVAAGTVGEGLSLLTETSPVSFSKSGTTLSPSAALFRGSARLRRVDRAWAQVRVGVFAWGAGLGVLSPAVVLCLAWTIPFLVGSFSCPPCFQAQDPASPWGQCFGSLFPSHCPRVA